MATLSIKRPQPNNAEAKKIELQSVSNLFLADNNLAEGLSVLLEEKIYNPSNPAVKEFENYCYEIIRKCFGTNFARTYFTLESDEIRSVLLSAKESQTAEFTHKEFKKGQSACYIIIGQNFITQFLCSEDRLAAVLVHECLHLWRRKASLSGNNSKPEEADCNIQCMHILYHAGYNHMAIHDLFVEFAKTGRGSREIFGAHIESKTMARLLKDESGRMTASSRAESRLSERADKINSLRYLAEFLFPPSFSDTRGHAWWHLKSAENSLSEALRVTIQTVDILCSGKLQNNYYLFWKAMSTMAHIYETLFKDQIVSSLWRGNANLKDYEAIADHFIRLEDFVRENEKELTVMKFRPETIGDRESSVQELYENYRYVFTSGLGSKQYIANKFTEFTNHKSGSDLLLLAEEITDFLIARPEHEFGVNLKISGFLGADRSNLEYDPVTQTCLIKNPASRFQQAIKLYLKLRESDPEKADKLAFVLKLLQLEKYHPDLKLSSPEYKVKISIYIKEPELLFSYDSNFNLINVEIKPQPKEVNFADAIETLPENQKIFFRDFIRHGYYKSTPGKQEENTRHEKEIWRKHRSTKYNTDWSELKKDWNKFFKTHIREISCPFFNADPTDWQLKFCSELESLFENFPDKIKPIADFFIDNNLFIPRILFECRDHKLRHRLVSDARTERSINIRIDAKEFYLMGTSKLYSSLYDRDLQTDFNPTFRNYIIRFFMTSSHIDWGTKDWFYLRSAKRYCNDSYSYNTRHNRGIRLTTNRAQILFGYYAPQSISEIFDLFKPKPSFHSLGMPISQELTLLESERLLTSGIEQVQSSQLVKVLEFAYTLFSTKRIEQLEHYAKKLAIKNFLRKHDNPEELIEEYFNQKKLNLKLNHLSINQIYELEKQILQSLENITAPAKRLNALELLLLDENAKLSDGYFSDKVLPRKKLYSTVALDELSELYARTFTELYGTDDRGSAYHDFALSKIKQIIIQSTCPKKMVESLLISANAQESLCLEAEMILRNVFINSHLYEEIGLELLIDELSRDQYSITATRNFLTSPLSNDSRQAFVAELEDNKRSLMNSISGKAERLWQDTENNDFEKLMSQKSHSHLLELASAFYLTFWSFGIKERAFMLDKIIIPPKLDSDLDLRAEKIRENYQIAKQKFFNDSEESAILSEITDAYFEALNQLGQQKTEKARLLVSALMIARNPMIPGGDSMQSCSQVISACFFEIGDKLMQCLDSAGFPFPESKYKASPLGQIATWQLLRSRNIKADQLHERLGSGGAALVYKITKEGKELALRIQREGIQQKADDYINELKLTARILSIKDSKYKLANEVVSTLELTINKEIRPANWRSQIDLHAKQYNNKTYDLKDGRKIIFRAPRITEINTAQAYFISEIASGTEVIAVRDIIKEQELREICSYQIITDLSAELSGLASCNDRHAGQVKLQRDVNNLILWQLDPVGFELRNPSQPELQFLGKILSRAITLPVIVSKGATGFFELLEQESDKEINNPSNPQEIVNFLKLRRLGWHARKDFLRHTNPGDLIGHLSSLNLHPEIKNQLKSWQRAFLRK